MKNRNILLIALLLLAFAFPVFAQEVTEEAPIPPEWMLFLPTVLSSLVGLNFKITDIFRRMLSSNNFGATPPKDVQNIIVIVFSLLLGIGLVLVTPNAANVIPDALTTWLPLKIAYAGISVSVLGGFVYDLSKRINGGNPVFETKTTLNVPPSDVAPDVAKATVQAAAQVAKADVADKG